MSKEYIIVTTSSNGNSSDLEKRFNEADYTPEEYHALLRKADLRLVLVYCIALLLIQIEKTNIANAAIINLEDGHGIKKELGNLTSGQWAWCISIFYYPYIFFEPLATILLKKFTPRIWQSRLMVVWGICALAQAGAKTYGGMLTVRFFLGLAEAGFYPSVLYHLGFWYKPKELSARIAILYTSSILAGAVTGILAYGISFMDQLGNLSGWRWLFIIEGIPCVLMGVYCFFFLPNYPQDSKFLTEREKKIILVELPESVPSAKGSFFSWPLIKDLLKEPTFYTYALYWLFQGIGGWGVSFVLPNVILSLGFTGTAQTQLMVIPPSIAGFLLGNLSGILVHKKIFKAYKVAITLSIIQVIGYIVLISISNHTAKYIMLVMVTATCDSLFPTLWPDRMRVVKGTSATGLAVGITNAAACFFGIAGPQIYQVKFAPKYRVSYAVSIALCSIGTGLIALTYYYIKRDGLLDTEGALKDGEEDENLKLDLKN